MKSYFNNLFDVLESVEDIDVVLSMVNSSITADNHVLEAEFNFEEFKVAINQMYKDKSPSPNRFNPAFYKKLWGVL